MMFEINTSSEAISFDSLRRLYHAGAALAMTIDANAVSCAAKRSRNSGVRPAPHKLMPCHVKSLEEDDIAESLRPLHRLSIDR